MTSPPPRKFDAKRMVDTVTSYGHNQTLGLRYAAHGDDWVEVAMDYDPRLAMDGESGVIASGPIVSMMDMAATLATWIRLDRFRPQATLDLRVDYLRAATPGRTVTGHGECYRITRSVAFVRGYAHDGDPADPLAHIAGTYMFTDTE